MIENGNTPALRKSKIMETLNKSSEIRVADLSRILNASVVTVRKDLDELEQEGLLERVHGGAVKNFKIQQNTLSSERLRHKKQEKEAIASAASDIIKSGDSVIINTGSTSYYVAKEFKKKRNLIVITNALCIFNIIAYYKNITTFFLGGQFNVQMQLTYGDETIEQLSKYHADKLFLGFDGIDIQAGATTYNHLEDNVIHAMMQRSEEKILIVDDSKLKRVTFAYVAPLTDFDKIITNYVPAYADYYKQLQDLGLEVITV